MHDFFVWMYVDLVYQLQSLVYHKIRLCAQVSHFLIFLNFICSFWTLVKPNIEHWTIKSRVNEKWFRVGTWKVSKTSPELHFGVTKKDPGLVFHFHVWNLFKSWSKLGLTGVQNEHIKLKKIKKMENLRTEYYYVIY